ncbi:hypothetical protein CDO73_16880 [Saccharibacillus sp. O23]|uniref:SUKH-4 family immunity protein n=1 Tax=Saccharibacillus sp. O23 TaxID=2009338 RepID=UPI000B4E211E|nr:SUKH-4 family immunity protein [Saccharibacillus sp. O23]OWR28887.1 hypothetical protein CDO73_16880 [Saccharibacillus sp. O23]
MNEISDDTIFFKQELSERYALPESASVLLRGGLLQPSELEEYAGVRFADDLEFAEGTGPRTGGRCPIAYVWERTAEYLVIESGSGEIRACGPDGGKSVFVNTDLSSLLRCLNAYREFRRRRPPVPQPLTLNAEEARRMLEAFRRGEIKPKRTTEESARREADERRERLELRALRDTLRREDPACLERRGTWWKIVLEQVRDGLI